jgi:uncharacterized membrane protein
MNTLFKFFNQVWVLWALVAAIALPRLWRAAMAPHRRRGDTARIQVSQGEVAPAMADVLAGSMLGPTRTYRLGRGWTLLWRLSSVLLVIAGCVYVLFGTPSRLSQRFVGWVPPFGTLNGMDYMQQGRYAWPNDANWIELRYDYAAILWILEQVRGNVVIAESAEVDYYRAGGTRVASMTGLSGLRGAHVSEQRYGEQVGARDGLHREFWSAAGPERTQELIDTLQITLIYVGQLERFHHPESVQKLAKMASEGRLVVLYENEGVTLYAVPGRLVLTEGGWYVPVPQAAPLPSVGSNWPVQRVAAQAE